MIKEVYSSAIDDITYRPREVEISGRLDAYINQIRNLLFGTAGTVFGASDMPVDLEQYIFALGVNAQALERLVSEKIAAYATLSKHFNTNVTVNYQRGTLRPVAFIDIRIDGIKRLGVSVR